MSIQLRFSAQLSRQPFTAPGFASFVQQERDKHQRADCWHAPGGQQPLRDEGRKPAKRASSRGMLRCIGMTSPSESPPTAQHADDRHGQREESHRNGTWWQVEFKRRDQTEADSREPDQRRDGKHGVDAAGDEQGCHRW